MNQLRHFIKTDKVSKSYTNPISGRGRCDKCLKENTEILYTRSPDLIQGQICYSCAKKLGLLTDTSKNRELPRYTNRNGKRISKCCGATLISKYGDSFCSNCNTQITWRN